jgi:predicted nucleic acid-binding Zn ribbon protein
MARCLSCGRTIPSEYDYCPKCIKEHVKGFKKKGGAKHIVWGIILIALAFPIVLGLFPWIESHIFH